MSEDPESNPPREIAGFRALLDLRDLHCVIAIAHWGSFMRAARTLNMTQPSVSARVRQLEERLGVPLFERQPRGVRPTSEGEIFLAGAREVLTRANTLMDDMVSIAGSTPTGLVRIGLPMSLTKLLTIPILDRCREELPGVKVRIVESLSGYISNWLIDGQLDLGVLFGKESAPGLVSRPVVEEYLLVAASGPDALTPFLQSDGTIPFARLAEMDLILPSPQHGLRDLIERQAQTEDIELRVALEIDAFGEIQRLVARGDGFALLSSAAIGVADAPVLATARVTQPPISRTVGVAYDPNRPLGRAAREVMLRLEDEMRRLASTNEWEAASI